MDSIARRRSDAFGGGERTGWESGDPGGKEVRMWLMRGSWSYWRARWKGVRANESRAVGLAPEQRYQKMGVFLPEIFTVINKPLEDGHYSRLRCQV